MTQVWQSIGPADHAAPLAFVDAQSADLADLHSVALHFPGAPAVRAGDSAGATSCALTLSLVQTARGAFRLSRTTLTRGAACRQQQQVLDAEIPDRCLSLQVVLQQAHAARRGLALGEPWSASCVLPAALQRACCA